MLFIIIFLILVFLLSQKKTIERFTFNKINKNNKKIKYTPFFPNLKIECEYMSLVFALKNLKDFYNIHFDLEPYKEHQNYIIDEKFWKNTINKFLKNYCKNKIIIHEIYPIFMKYSKSYDYISCYLNVHLNYCKYNAIIKLTYYQKNDLICIIDSEIVGHETSDKVKLLNNYINKLYYIK